MNTNAVAESPAMMPAVRERSLRPSLLGAVGGELLKLRRQRATLAMLAGAVVLFMIVMAAVFSGDNVRQTLHRDPAVFFSQTLDILLQVFNMGSGIFLLIVASRLVGMEYTSGTIRVLLARGIGRVQLLVAKLIALVLVGLALLAGFLVLSAATLYVAVTAWEGSFTPITSLPGIQWHDLGMCVIISLISIGAGILLGTAAAVVGRSLVFGVGVALAFFPADNFGTIVMMLLGNITRQTFWPHATAYFLGPNLNVLPTLLETGHKARASFAVPLQNVDTTHSLVVIGVYAAIFLVVSVFLTWRRDVLE